MWKQFDRYLAAVWGRYGLLGIVIIVVLLGVMATWFGVDVAGLIQGLVK